MQLSDEIQKVFGNKIRIRVCGVLEESQGILMLLHKGVGIEGTLWAPPGGGLEFGEKIETALKREFLEETGLDVEVGEFLFLNEFIEQPLHAVELYFRVTRKGGIEKKGIDPELVEQSSLSEMRWMDWSTLESIPDPLKHSCFTSKSVFHSKYTQK